MDGYTVDPDVLTKYASGLDDRGGKVTAAANRIQEVNGGDINAFGVVVGQVLGIPTRIALGVLHDQVNGAAKAITDQAGNTRTAADQYRTTETNHAQAITTAGTPT
ncbi:type VII secretion target [Amycolatopsis sp. NPDC023774]|uniref:type VII secretion target n=1 Tax=Amycolatopsis sp. NPDC023774 TaxID=3155015 RepID=UPI0033FE90C7